MKTRAQKQETIEKSMEAIKKSELMLFADFSGVSVSEISRLRKTLRDAGAKFTVIKKKLLRVAFQKLGLDFNPEQFDSQLGTVFSSKDISVIAGPVYRFSRETLGANKKERFKILGAFEVAAKKFLSGEEVKAIGQLPPREVLLGQLMGAISGPMRALLYVLSERGKSTPTS